MIDRERRRKIALHLRHYLAGLITNDDYESQAYGGAKSDDPVIRAMYLESWFLQDDMKCHKLTGSYKPTTEQFKYMARIILFLHSDCEYEWPKIDPWSYQTAFYLILLSLPLAFLLVAHLGIYTLLIILASVLYFLFTILKGQWEFYKFNKVGDYDYWPFISKEQYEAQLTKQPFLTGKNKWEENKSNHEMHEMHEMYEMYEILQKYG